MGRTRILASVLVVALAGMSLGVATAWFSDSETIAYQISAASDFGEEVEEKVWVCRLVGSPDDPEIKAGENPIHVSVNSTDAEEGFSDAHPSYVVEDGEVECEVPDLEKPDVEGAANEDPDQVDQAEATGEESHQEEAEEPDREGGEETQQGDEEEGSTDPETGD